jgi:RNA polymerase-binding transcription factor DksA
VAKKVAAMPAPKPAKKVALAPVKPARPAAAKPAAAKPAVAKPAAAKPAAAKPAAAKAPNAKSVAVAPKQKQVALVREKKAEPTNGKLSGFVAKQKQRLLDLRDELLTSMFGVTRDTLRNAPEGSEASGSGMHQGDAGSDAYDRDFALSVLAKEQDALYEIDQALKRIDRGTYGICEMSGRRIPQARLEAIPFARLTVECQAEWEKEHGNRRFRPSNEVGFGGGIYEEDDESESVSLDEEED